MRGYKAETAVASFSKIEVKSRKRVFAALTGLTLGLCVLISANAAKAALNPFVPERAGVSAPNTLRGDFNGDAIQDEIYSVTEGEGRDARIGIHVRLSDGAGFVDQRLTSVDARESYNLSVASSRSFRSDCGTFSDSCSAAPITPEHDSLILSLESGVELLVYFDKAHFEQAFIASDEGLMRRTLRAFYAMQP